MLKHIWVAFVICLAFVQAVPTEADFNKRNVVTIGTANTYETCADSASAGLGPQSVLFVDPGVEDFQHLLGGLTEGVAVYVLDSQKDGVEEIAAYLASHKNLASIHIVSHGYYGQITLGASELNNANIENYRSDAGS